MALNKETTKKDEDGMTWDERIAAKIAEWIYRKVFVLLLLNGIFFIVSVAALLVWHVMWR